MDGVQARRCNPAELAAALTDVRARLLAMVDDLDDRQWRVPSMPGVNPIAWELAHVAWFAEWWTLRGPHRAGADGRLQAQRPPRHAGPDALLDSSRLAHADRWSAPMPDREQVQKVLAAQLDDCLDALARLPDEDGPLYFHRLALMHEAMHCEALEWLRAALGYPAPGSVPPPRVSPAPLADSAACSPAGPVPVAGATVLLGWPDGEAGFVFDNERGQRAMTLADFDIDPAPVTAGRFVEFVEAGGYREPKWWPGEAGRWLARSGREHPERWRRGSVGWELRWFDRWRPLDPDEVLIHVNAWEAEAFCRWAGRSLPSAAQWERAAGIGALRWGHSVWEWTADAFAPYPGFAPGPYSDYSAPWFGTHRELRGGAFATTALIHHPRYRNFFTPERTDVFAGFRTASLPPDASR